MKTNNEMAVQLATQMLSYAVMSCEKCENRRSSEILRALGFFFSDEELDEARKTLCGSDVIQQSTKIVLETAFGQRDKEWMPLSEAEFLSKRLGRVARLTGVQMPDMGDEAIAQVAGTILGQIAFNLEKAPNLPMTATTQMAEHGSAVSGYEISQETASRVWEQMAMIYVQQRLQPPRMPQDAMTSAVDAAMQSVSNVSPAIQRTHCHQIIQAALPFIPRGGFSSEDIQRAFDNGKAQGSAVPISSVPGLQEQIRRGLQDGTLVIGGQLSSAHQPQYLDKPQLATPEQQDVVTDSDTCPDCKQPWPEHDFGVPKPTCP